MTICEFMKSVLFTRFDTVNGLNTVKTYKSSGHNYEISKLSGLNGKIFSLVAKMTKTYKFSRLHMYYAKKKCKPLFPSIKIPTFSYHMRPFLHLLEH